MSSFDLRTTLARGELADLRLEGLVRAERFAGVRSMACVSPVAALRKAPRPDSEQQDQLLFGEAFDVLEVHEGWAWGQARRDGYVGFVRAENLAAPGDAPTHRVRALRTPGFSRPDIKAEPVGLYSMNALVAAETGEGRFAQAGVAGWMLADHLAPIGVFETDPADVALRFLGAPYVWGGRDSLGLDCSGLIQQALYACGRACPRDTDLQRQAFAQDLPRSGLARGDLVFWRGHVAMALGGERIVHANAHHMAVAVEPLGEAIDRIRKAGAGDPVAFRRP